MTHRKRLLIPEIAAAVLIVTAFAVGIYAQSSTATPENAPEKTLALRLIAAKTEDERSLMLRNEAAFVNVVLVRAFSSEVKRLTGKVPNAESERLCRIGLRLAERIGDRAEIAGALKSLGNALQDKNEKLAAYQRGLEITRSLADDSMTAKFYYNIGGLEDDQNKQIDILKLSVESAEKAGDKATEAAALGRIGNSYAVKGDYVTALEYHARAVAIREQLGDLFGLGQSYNNLGIINYRQGDLIAAAANYVRSLEIATSFDDKDGLGITYYNLGIVYFEMGDFSRAMTLYSRSLALFEEIDAGGGIEGVSTNIANLYIAQGNYDLARSYLDRASKIHDKTGKEIPQYALGSFGDSYKGEGNFEKAIDYYQKLLAFKEKGDNKDSLAETLVNIGNCYLLIPDGVKAAENFERALKLTESTGNHVWMFQSLIGLAETQLIRRDFQAALQSADLARSHYEKLSGTRESWELHLALGRAHRGLGHKGEARADFERAVSIVEGLRSRLAGGSSEQQGFLRDNVSPYRSMVDILVSNSSAVEALKYSELVKARTLLDALQSGKVKIDRSVTPQESAKEQLFRNELVSYRTQIERETGKTNVEPNVVTALQNQLAKKRLEFEDFQIRLYASHPELKTQRGEMKPISLDEAGTLLPDATSAAIEFAVADDKAFVFVITKDASNIPSLSVYPINIRQNDLTSKVEKYRSTLAAGDLDFQKQSRELYDLLLKPAALQLAGKTNVVIVPDGSLWDLPFQALQDGK
ncbi:MAG: tetratricopeptide repeat protein, partial [Pyrinomonadaceae bacterium]